MCSQMSVKIQRERWEVDRPNDRKQTIEMYSGWLRIVHNVASYANWICHLWTWLCHFGDRLMNDNYMLHAIYNTLSIGHEISRNEQVTIKIIFGCILKIIFPQILTQRVTIGCKRWEQRFRCDFNLGADVHQHVFTSNFQLWSHCLFITRYWWRWPSFNAIDKDYNNNYIFRNQNDASGITKLLTFYEIRDTFRVKMGRFVFWYTYGERTCVLVL